MVSDLQPEFVIWTLRGVIGSAYKTISPKYLKNGNEFLKTLYTKYTLN